MIFRFLCNIDMIFIVADCYRKASSLKLFLIKAFGFINIVIVIMKTFNLYHLNCEFCYNQFERVIHEMFIL